MEISISKTVKSDSEENLLTFNLNIKPHSNLARMFHRSGSIRGISIITSQALKNH